MRRVLDFKVEGQRKKGRLKMTQVEKERVKIALRRKYALCRSNWSNGVNQTAAGVRWPPSFVGDTIRF